MEIVKPDLSKTIFTVSSLNNLIKDIFDNCSILQGIRLQGELNGFKRHTSGHYFFTLVDENSSISATIFSFQVQDGYENFHDGDLVEATGSIRVYNKRGTYSFIITKMIHAGEGDVLLQKKLLIKKLENEGLFDDDKKIKIPKFPINIGIITSPTGAAITDIEKNIRLRNKSVNLYLFPCIVQGPEAINSILKAIERTKEYPLNTIIIGRGGGSSEDLSAFDSEKVVRAVCNLKPAVISAVGHERDKSICDFAADLSVSTPTAAAIAAVQDENELKDYLISIDHEVTLKTINKINLLRISLNKIESLEFFKDKKNQISLVRSEISKREIALSNAVAVYFDKLSNKLTLFTEKCEAINPNNVLKRGYAIITNDNKQILANVDKINSENSINIIVQDGLINIKRK